MIQLKPLFQTKVKFTYRKTIWDHILSNVRDLSNINNKFIVLPHVAGYEIPLLLSRGIQQEQIICIEKDRKTFLSAEWRQKYPNVISFNGRLSSLHTIIEDHWVLTGANFDFCGPISNMFQLETQMFFKQNAQNLDKHFTFACTISCGRELPAMTRKIRSYKNYRYPRIAAAINMLYNPLLKGSQLLCQNTYKNNVHRMLFFIIKLNKPILMDTTNRKNNSYTPEEDEIILKEINRAIAQGKSKASGIRKAFGQLEGRTEGAIMQRYYVLNKDEESDVEQKVSVTQIPPSPNNVDFKKRALTGLFDSLPIQEKQDFLLEQLSAM